MKCSRNLPAPVRIYSKRGEKVTLKYVLYPDLSDFKKACQACKFRAICGSAGSLRSECRLKDKDFMLKFYGLGKKVWVGTVPLLVRQKFPELCGGILGRDKRRAGGLYGKDSSGSIVGKRRSGQIKPAVADGIDILLCDFKSKADRSGDIVKSLVVETT